MEPSLTLCRTLKKVRSLILLNLGNSLPLKDLFSYLPPSALIHVIDSHRPIELDNLFESTHYGNALFDMRRVRGKGRGGMGGELGLPEMEKTIVVWTDGEGDENREAVKEAWEAMRVSGFLSSRFAGARLTLDDRPIAVRTRIGRGRQ